MTTRPPGHPDLPPHGRNWTVRHTVRMDREQYQRSGVKVAIASTTMSAPV
jgi:hypothetical protein